MSSTNSLYPILLIILVSFGSLISSFTLVPIFPMQSYVVQTLCQHMQNQHEIHFQDLKHTLGYLSTTIGQGIILTESDIITLQAYSDSDQAACPILDGLYLGLLFFLVLILSIGSLRNKNQFLNLFPKLNIDPWLLHPLELFG